LAIKKVAFVKKTALVTSIFGEGRAALFTGICSPDGCSEEGEVFYLAIADSKFLQDCLGNDNAEIRENKKNETVACLDLPCGQPP
jgi:hypothetical protein